MQRAQHLVLFILCALLSACQVSQPEVVPAPPEDFTVVLIPDTQYYALRDPATYIKQMQWIVDQRDQQNIVFGIHLGDITHNNTIKEWEAADAAHSILDAAQFPYSVCPGNHDNPDGGKVRDTTRYNRYFGQAHFAGQEFYGGGFEGTNDSNFTTFEASGLKFLVLSLEFTPRAGHIAWANEVIARHPDRRVIIATHCYQDHGGDYRTDCDSSYGLTGSCGKTIWEQLARRHANVFAVVSGHVGDSEYWLRSGEAGNPVHQILTDYQFERRNDKAHGNGWLRTLRFSPTNNRVDVRIHTVLDDVTKLNRTKHYNADPSHSDHAYSFDLEMAP